MSVRDDSVHDLEKRSRDATGLCQLCLRPLDDRRLRDPETREWLDQPLCGPRAPWRPPS